jgi:predicted dehydrogenase
MTTRVALVGATGHGASHLRTITELARAGRVTLVGLADVVDLTGRAPAEVPVFRDHESLLAATAPEVVVVSSPPHTHRPIAAAALRAGADVLLEKPPVLDLDEHDALEAVRREAGRAVQVGFQALASPALARLTDALRAGRLGTLRGIGVRAAWFRDEEYFRRAAWVGRRTVDGLPTVDGALANPFAHAVMQVLAIADAPLRTVEVERYRTTDEIEVDDTACLRLRFTTGVTAVIAVSLCAHQFLAGEITVTGSAGVATLEYPTDRLRMPGDHNPVEIPGRVRLLDDLLDHRADPTRPLLAPLARTRPFTALLGPIDAAQPVLVHPTHLQIRRDLPAPRRVLCGINDAIDAAAAQLALFSELRSAPWRNSPSPI